jgi:hypothetical protein
MEESLRIGPSYSVSGVTEEWSGLRLRTRGSKFISV